MPGWHEATKERQDAGDFQMLGLIQEQHPDRARLFMQWKEMKWPIMVDALNELQVRVVPITLFIDEHGIIRNNRPPRRNFTEALDAFLASEYEPPNSAMMFPMHQGDMNLVWLGARDGTPEEKRVAARKIYKWGGTDHLNDAIGLFEDAAAAEADDALGSFQLGVALRRRFESEKRQDGDFQAAVDAWSHALSLNPNQYIWRRRIEQFGPRLAKPYSFYDWVNTAREEIRARHQNPKPLRVEPSGAEFANPIRSFEADAGDAVPPPTDAAVTRDEELIDVEVTLVPPRPVPGTTMRVHVSFRPSETADGHWNNESSPMHVWWLPTEGVEYDVRHQVIENASTATSDEVRSVEFEIAIDEGVSGDELMLRGYGVFNVCRGVDGVCVYRRKDVTIRIPLQK